MIELKELTGRKVRPEQFKHVRTVGDVVTAVASCAGRGCSVTGGAAEPRIVSETLGPPVRLELAVAPDLPCFEGHFPGVPVLPGVVQLDWRFASAASTSE